MWGETSAQRRMPGTVLLAPAAGLGVTTRKGWVRERGGSYIDPFLQRSTLMVASTRNEDLFIGFT